MRCLRARLALPYDQRGDNMLLHILDYDWRHVVDGVCDEEAEAELCQAGAKSAPLDITHSKHVVLTICAHHVHMVSRSFVLF